MTEPVNISAELRKLEIGQSFDIPTIRIRSVHSLKSSMKLKIGIRIMINGDVASVRRLK